MLRPRCSNCNQPVLVQRQPPEPCGYCGYLDGGQSVPFELEDVELDGEPAGPSQFRRLVWWMAVAMMALTIIGSIWLMLRFQTSLVNMSQTL